MKYHLSRATVLAMITAGVVAGASNGTNPEGYLQHNLVSDGFIPAAHTDPNLVNAWGIAFNPDAVAWVADNGTGKATLYDGTGAPAPLVVTLEPPTGATSATPNGIVFSGGAEFVISGNGKSAPARFLFATEDGTIEAWSPMVDATHAQIVVDVSSSNAVFKGLALAGSGTGLFLYATDFHNGHVRVFNSSFQPVSLAGSFEDPNIPAGFAPFGIQNVGGDLFVTYAKQDADAHDDVKGAGNGFVDLFDAQGHLLRRFASRGELNSPWGIALAPASFGRFGGRLLVGNFGDGFIHAYDFATGEPLGALRRPDGSALHIDGLWGLAFGNGLKDQPTNVLFFAAGPADEAHGLYGRIEAMRCGTTPCAAP